jgi:hypothetical protein
MNKYNGFNNRSTWLVNLHLNNTSLDVYNTMIDIIAGNKKSEAIRAMYQLVMKHTNIKTEQGFLPDEIDWNEVYKANKD